ncbi:MAG: hypothetical protein ACPGSG_00560 [Prolixibacteraceae bacterium]
MNQENKKHSDKLLEETIVSSLRESKEHFSIPLNFSSKVVAAIEQRISYWDLIKLWGGRCALWLFCTLVGIGAYLYSIKVPFTNVTSFLSAHYLMFVFPLLFMLMVGFINDVILKYYCEKYHLPD